MSLENLCNKFSKLINKTLRNALIHWYDILYQQAGVCRRGRLREETYEQYRF